MIVDPDFLDHWKTRMLVDLLDFDEAAPIYVIRLWSHCQLRRAWEFEGMTATTLRSICRYKGDADKFEAALVASGFVVRTDSALVARGWDEYNSTLIAAWTNGKKGGRPKLNPVIPQETQDKPNGKPMGLPMENQAGKRLDGIRSDQIGSEGKNSSSPSATQPTAEVFLTFPVAGAPGSWNLTVPQIAEWSELYPAIDIRAECRKALAWIKANHKKTAKGMERFLVNWLGKATNDHRSGGHGKINGNNRPVSRDFIQENPVASDDAAIFAEVERRNAERLAAESAE